MDTIRLRCVARDGFFDWAERSNGFVQTKSSSHNYQTAWHVSGVGRFEDYRYADGRSYLNFEYRPHEDDPSQVLGRLLTPKTVGRADFALDYPLDLSGYSFDAKRMKRERYASANDKLETLYLGARKSDLRYRIYDKAREAGLPAPLWRIEAQTRRGLSDALPDDLFDALVVRSAPATGTLRYADAASLAYAHSRAGVHRAYCTNTAKRAQALLDRYAQPLDPAPSLVYRATLPYLRSGIEALLEGASAFVGTVAL